MVKTKTTTSKNDNEMFVEDTVFVPCDNLEKLPVMGFNSVPKQTENSVNIKKQNEAECSQRHETMLINLNQDALNLAVLGRRMEIRELKDEQSVVGQLLDRRTCRLRPYVHLAARYPEGEMKPDDPVLKDTTGRRLTLRATSLNVYQANSLNELQIISETGKAMGCAWEKYTCTSGTQLTNTALINALKAQTCFEECELLGFEVKNLSWDCYALVNTQIFRPSKRRGYFVIYVKVRTPAMQLLLDNREHSEPPVESKYLGTRTRDGSVSPRCYKRENVHNMKNCDTTTAKYTNTDCNSGTVLGWSVTRLYQ